jgi:pteridine reductase
MGATRSATPVALVTGAGRRVGRAIAEALGTRGMRVVVHYNESADGAHEAVRAIDRAGGSAVAMQADLALASDARRLIETVVATEGGLNVLVNSAAIMLRTPVGETTVDDWDAMFAINVRAPYLLAQSAAPALRVARGSIVNIADLAAFETWPAYVPHGMTKAAIVQMTRGLARALAPEIRVNAVAPGVVLLPEGWSDADATRLRDTTPLGVLGDPADVARAVLYLLDASFVTGEVLRVDGGRHIRT